MARPPCGSCGSAASPGPGADAAMHTAMQALEGKVRRADPSIGCTDGHVQATFRVVLRRSRFLKPSRCARATNPVPCPASSLLQPPSSVPRRSTLAADEQVVWRWRSVSRASGERWQQLGQASSVSREETTRPDGLMGSGGDLCARPSTQETVSPRPRLSGRWRCTAYCPRQGWR